MASPVRQGWATASEDTPTDYTAALALTDATAGRRFTRLFGVGKPFAQFSELVPDEVKDKGAGIMRFHFQQQECDVIVVQRFGARECQEFLEQMLGGDAGRYAIGLGEDFYQARFAE